MSMVRRSSALLALLLLLSLGGCMEAATWWSKTQGIAFDQDNHACPASQVRDGRCQSAAAQGGTP